VYVALTWLHYGQVNHAKGEDADPLLDRFMPVYEVVERHKIRVSAPAEVTLAAACEADLQATMLVRTIFRGRELLLGSAPDEIQRPRGLLALTKSLG
jgi:hypothetical protein